MSNSPSLQVPKLSVAPDGDFSRLPDLFADAVVMNMNLLLPTPPASDQPEVVSTEVRAGWTPEALWLHATMEDTDIGNSATKLNEDTWATGDVFEVFIRNDKTTRYWEIHVTPENQKLQLLWPKAESISEARAAKAGLKAFYVWENAFDSWTQVRREANQWQVLCKLPAALLYEAPAELKPGNQWYFSFCRYDYNSDKAKPTLYSTSRYIQYDFHHMPSWGKLEFVETPA